MFGSCFGLSIQWIFSFWVRKVDLVEYEVYCCACLVVTTRKYVGVPPRKVPLEPDFVHRKLKRVPLPSLRPSCMPQRSNELFISCATCMALVICTSLWLRAEEWSALKKIKGGGGGVRASWDEGARRRRLGSVSLLLCLKRSEGFGAWLGNVVEGGDVLYVVYGC